MKNNITYFVSEFLLSFKWWAEHSIYKKMIEDSETTYKCFTFDNTLDEWVIHEKNIIVYNYHFPIFLGFSRFWTLLLNYWKIIAIVKTYIPNNSVVWSQSLIVPYISNVLRKKDCKNTYFLRDELQLNEFHNYEVWARKYLKYIKNIVEFFPIFLYKYLNKKALEQSHKIISNSFFIHDLLFKKYALNSKVEYPEIDLDKFRKCRLEKANQKYITFIWVWNAMKGDDIALEIAAKLRKKEFLFIWSDAEFKKWNIHYIPWQKDILEVYKQTNILIVPSRWKEAYWRIVIEAQSLWIKVIVSDRGWLREALNNENKNNYIADIRDIKLWVDKIINN